MLLNLLALLGLFAPQDVEDAAGVVVELTDTSVTVKTNEGPQIRFFAPMVRRDDGSIGYDRRILEQLGGLKKGDRVVLGWIEGDDRRYLTKIEKEDAPPPKTDKPKPKKEPKKQEAEGEQLVEGTYLEHERGDDGLGVFLQVGDKTIEFRSVGEEVKGKFVPKKEIAQIVEKLKRGFLVGLGYRWDGGQRWIQWIFLIKGGDVDQREVWEREKKGYEKEKAESGKRKTEGDKPKTDKPQIPEGLIGFSGRVRGVIVEKGDKAFYLKVAKILNVWEGNKAKDVELLIGRVVRVEAAWEEGDDGKWHQVEPHLKFIRGLKEKQELTVEIQHAEREVFQILELGEEDH